MKLLKIDFNEIQKAMEDVSRDAFDYFLDLETGEIKTISVDALEGAKSSLYRGDELIDESSLEDYTAPTHSAGSKRRFPIFLSTERNGLR
ncbi:MAG: hypothetical protein HYR78_00090 [Nitrospirae bacterium]|nr:hypothetical protein [Nitrospirota bacterium]